MLQEAVIKGDLDLVRETLHGENDNLKLTYGSCICLAARKKYWDIVKLLLEYGWDVNQEDAQGQTPIYYSIGQNDVETTKVLLQYGAKINGKSEYDRTIFLAARKGFEDIVQVLVDFGADVNSKDEYGQTPLHYAILQDCTVFTFLQGGSSVKICVMENIVRALLGNGSDVNAKTVNGFSPLHYAVKLKYATIVRALLEYGADFHSPVDSDIKSPKLSQFRQKSNLRIMTSTMKPSLTTVVHIAAESNDVQSLTALLNAGATVDSVQYDGATPLIVGIKRQLDSVVTLLLESGADIEQRSKYGLTPLHVACRKGSVKVLNSLLAAGADINAVCNKGKVPYKYVLQLEDEMKNEFIAGGFFLTEHHYYYKFYTNSISMKKTLQNHLIMMYVNGFYLQDFNKMIAMNTPSTLDKVFKKEIEEFSKMVTVCKGVTLYHVINDIRNPFYIRNPNVFKGLDQAVVVTNAKYPGFGSIVKYLVRRAQVRVDLINKGVEWFKLLNVKNNELPPLPVEILELVLSFLLDEDIKNFINCVEVLCHRNNGSTI